MKCSIVITTFDKPESLDLVLTSIYKQEPNFDWEVIVVNDGPADKTVEVCLKYAKLYLNFTYEYTRNSEYRNPVFARNVGYRKAKGDIIICQCDDVIHISPGVIERLVVELREGEFLLSKTENHHYNGEGKSIRYIGDYCSPNKRPVPFFFCGSILREDLYAVGGNDEDFKTVCYDDNWFADCIMNGLKLKPRHSSDIITHHMSHKGVKFGRVEEAPSRKLYASKVKEARSIGVWQAASGPWKYEPFKDKTKCIPNCIPKCMNFYWASDKLSWIRYLTLKSFRIHNLDWDIKLYTSDIKCSNQGWKSKEIQDCGEYTGKDYWNQVESLDIEIIDYEAPIDNLAPAHASDFFQWELLSTEGGFYADMDILFLKPIPYEKWKNNDTVYCLSRGYASIGFFGSTPNSLLFRHVLCQALSGYNGAAYQNTGAEAFYRAGGLGRSWAGHKRPGEVAMAMLRNKFKSLKYEEVQEKSFYPWAWNEVDRIWMEINVIPNNCIGIHWFGGTPKSQMMNNSITPSNVTEIKNTFTKYAQYLL